jgi:hypothetical protein
MPLPNVMSDSYSSMPCVSVVVAMIYNPFKLAVVCG